MKGRMGTPFAEPARRMFADAERLWGHQRLGTADHLFGLAAECALKAILCGVGVITDPPKPPFKEHINKLWDEYLTTLQGRPAALSVPQPNPFSDWTVNHRYSDDSVFIPDRVDPHREGAKAALAAFEGAEAQGAVR